MFRQGGGPTPGKRVVFGPKAQQCETEMYEEGYKNNRPEGEEGERLESPEKIEYLD